MSEAQLARKLSTREKFVQGIGGAIDPARALVVTPLFLYYHTILGVSGTLIGFAVAIIVAIDAITDPLIGAWSDNTRSSIGRRHPFMYSAMLPLGVCIYLLMNPPLGLNGWQMALWVGVVGSVLNISYTLFLIPYNAMLAELTDDYDERTKLAAYRSGILVMATVILQALALIFFLSGSDECAQGQLNAEGYRGLGWAAALLAMAIVFVTTHFTRGHIPHLPQATPAAKTTLKALIADLRRALSSRNFLLLFGSLLLFGMLMGTAEVMGRHMLIFFWGFTSEQEVVLLLTVFGALVGVAISGWLQKRFEKNTLIIIMFLVFFLSGAMTVLGRFLNIVPANGTPELVVFLVIVNFIRVGAVTLTLLFFLSLLGDIVLEHEYNTGERQGGAMYAGQGFAEKAILGFGLIIGGIALDWVGLPSGEGICNAVATPEQIYNLGWVAGVAIPILSCLPLYLVYKIDLTRARYDIMREAVEARRSSETGPKE